MNELIRLFVKQGMTLDEAVDFARACVAECKAILNQGVN